MKKHQLWKRMLAVVLCVAALTCTAIFVPFSSTRAEEITAQEEVTTPLEEVTAAEEATASNDLIISLIPPLIITEDQAETTTQASIFWSWFSFMSYMFDPDQSTFHNTKSPFQRIFGFNMVYDFFAFLAGVLADTLRIKFEYEGREWLVQLWKGAYAYGICTGGEIGLYSKPLSRSINQYDCAPQKDWIGMSMSIYHGDEKLFTRPMEKQWWCTGYRPHILSSLLDRPRDNCTMDSLLEFKTPEMAALFAQALEAKGFKQVPQEEGINWHVSETYTIQGSVVHLLWRNVTESYT